MSAGADISASSDQETGTHGSRHAACTRSARVCHPASFPGYDELAVMLNAVQIVRAPQEATPQPSFPEAPPIPIADSLAHRDHGLVR